MNRIDRLNALLIQLQGKHRVHIGELEDRFGISRRTIFRDIKSLLEAGVPIGGDAGEGYFIVEGYHLPPVVFNKEEAAAILLGAKLIEKNADRSVATNFETAMHKVRAVLKYSDKDFLNNLEDRVSILSSPTLAHQGFPESHLGTIQSGIANRLQLDIHYFASYNDTTTHRIVEPLGLVFYSNRWHLIAYCHLRHDMRDFRTDRMTKVNLTNLSFDPDSHPDYLEFTSGMLGGTDAKKATVRFRKEVTRYIADQKYHYGFVSEIPMGDEVEMQFVTPQYEFLARWLLMFGNDATVVGPNTLQGLVATYAKDSFLHHKKYFEISEKPVT